MAAIKGEMMLWASLKLLAKKERARRKEAKKMVRSRSNEKNKTIFMGCSIGPMEEGKSPIMEPMENKAMAMLVSDKLAANNPEHMVTNNFPIRI